MDVCINIDAGVPRHLRVIGHICQVGIVSFRSVGDLCDRCSFLILTNESMMRMLRSVLSKNIFSLNWVARLVGEFQQVKSILHNHPFH